MNAEMHIVLSKTSRRVRLRKVFDIAPDIFKHGFAALAPTGELAANIK